MPEIISDLFQVKDRYLRSAHLERDFSDPKALNGYVLTAPLQANLQRLAGGLSLHSGQRAWRITGDYGSGKSSFALVLAHLFAGKSEGLPAHLRHAVNFKELGVSRSQLLPVLITGSREPLSVALLRSLKRTLLDSHKRGRPPVVLEKIQQHLDAVATGATLPDQLVVEVITQTNGYVRAGGKGAGLLIILDELGKILEFAALHPDQQDIYLLQSLAEAASRSGKEPLFVVGLLHQGFNAYADQLSQPAQREWEKVAGRFEEILFNQPLDQISTLIAAALHVRAQNLPDEIVAVAKRDMGSTLALGWYGAQVGSQELIDQAPLLYPLHPTVLPVLVKLFSRFGQNERSLFSFLLSNEPFGLQDFARQTIREGEFYRLHNLYDYARATFGHRLSLQSYRSHWNLIDSMITSFHADSALDLQVIKTVGLLNLLDAEDLLPSAEVIKLSVARAPNYKKGTTDSVIDKLQQGRRILYERGAAGGFCLWPHTSVNLERAYEEASRAVGREPQRVSTLIQDYLETRPIVARRHYIETGNLRHFEVRYVPVVDLSSQLEFSYDITDGRILIALCETEEEHKEALLFAKSECLRDRSEILFAVPKPLVFLAQLIQEVQRWEWVSSHTPELGNDNFAVTEVNRRLTAARQALEKRIYDFIGLKKLSGRTDLRWFRQNEALVINNGRDLLGKLSSICEELYNLAPAISNELINRRSLSSAAAGARMRLIERMFESPSAPLLGMNPDKKPPEMSMYLSVLRRGGLHRQVDGSYELAEPKDAEDICRVRPALSRIKKILEERSDSRVRVSEIFRELRRPPYGVRDGVSPLLLAIFAVINEHNVAFYERGQFMRHMSALDLMLLTKNPELFEIQYFKIAGVRADLFEKLIRILELKPTGKRQIDLLDIVRPLCVFAAQLPPYTHNTTQLSAQALAVRRALLDAREPSTLLFRDLPEACGFAPFNADKSVKSKEVQAFVISLKSVVDELKTTYPKLHDKMRTALADCFDIPGHFIEARQDMAERAETILLGVHEPNLKAFCMCLADRSLPEAEWLEALGSFICSKPPSRWTDEDFEVYLQELNQLCARFRRVESIVFKTQRDTIRKSAVRVDITQLDGSEVNNVIYVKPEEERRVAEIEAKISSLINKTKRIGLAATARAFWKALAKEEVISAGGKGEIGQEQG